MRVARTQALRLTWPLGAQSGEGVVEFWRDTDQQGFIFHLISEYITAFTGDHEVDGGGPEC